MNSLLEPTIAPGAPAPAADLPAPPPAAPAAPVATPAWFVWACPCCHATLRTLTTARRGTCPACGSLIEAPEPPAPQPAPAASTQQSAFAWSRLLWPLAIALALAATAGVTVVIARTQPWKHLGLGRGATKPVDTPPPTTAQLQQLIAQFLQAPDWKGKSAYIIDATRLESRGLAYYQGRDPDTLTVSQFQPSTLPGLPSNLRLITLRAERPGHRPVIAAFGRTPQGWRLDWELFTQSYDESFHQFLAHPAFPIRTFRARLQRTFPDQAPENALSIDISDPLEPGQRIGVSLPMGTPIASSIAQGLSGTSPRSATVEVCWSRPDPEGEWIPCLQRLVCWEWNGLTGRPESAPPAAPANERFLTPAASPLASPPPPAEQTAPAPAPTAP